MIDLLARFTDVRERVTSSGVSELLLVRRPAPAPRQGRGTP
jgi:hypothetical protein